MGDFVFCFLRSILCGPPPERKHVGARKSNRARLFHRQVLPPSRGVVAAVNAPTFISSPVLLDNRRIVHSNMFVVWFRERTQGRADVAGDVELDVHAGGHNEVRREGEGPTIPVFSTFLGQQVLSRCARAKKIKKRTKKRSR